jgi:hypothetical protein
VRLWADDVGSDNDVSVIVSSLFSRVREAEGDGGGRVDGWRCESRHGCGRSTLSAHVDRCMSTGMGTASTCTRTWTVNASVGAVSDL